MEYGKSDDIFSLGTVIAYNEPRISCLFKNFARNYGALLFVIQLK